MTNYFLLYGLPVTFAPDLAAVKAKYYELSRLHHPDRYAQAGGQALADALRLAADNNEAWATLKSPDATMAYVLKLHGLLADDEKYALPPAFLMEMMDLNELVSDCEADPTNTEAATAAKAALEEQLNEWEATTQPLTRRYDAGELTDALLVQIKDMYFRRKYLLRIRERIDKFAAR